MDNPARYKIYFLTEGNHTDSSGELEKHDREYIDALVKNYEATVFESPVVIGHEEDISSIYTNDTAPSFGWVKGIGEDEQGVYALTEINTELAEQLEKTVPPYKYISAALYDKNNPYNPKRGKAPYLRHIAFLGATPPAIKGLPKMIKYSETSEDIRDYTVLFNTKYVEQLNNKETMQTDTELYTEAEEIKIPDASASKEEINTFLQQNAADFLSYILMDGETGYIGEISRYEPEPTAENNYLYDKDSKKFAGVFYDDTSSEIDGFEFEIQKKGDTWTSFFIPVDRSSLGLDEYGEETSKEALLAEIAASMKAPEAEEDTYSEGEKSKTKEELLKTIADAVEAIKNLENENEEEDEEEYSEEIITPTPTPAEASTAETSSEVEEFSEEEEEETEVEAEVEDSVLTHEEETALASGNTEGITPAFEAEAGVGLEPTAEDAAAEREKALQAEYELMVKESKALREEVLSLKQEVAELKLSEFKTYSETKKDLLEGTSYKVEDLTNLLLTAEKVSVGKVAATFSEKTGKSFVTALQNLFDEIQSKIKDKAGIPVFGEFAPDGAEEKTLPDIEIPGRAYGTTYDPASFELYKEIIRFCENKGLDYKNNNDYLRAYKAVVNSR